MSSIESWLVAVLVLPLLACASAPSPQPNVECAPAGYSRAMLDELKAGGWGVPDAAARNRLALELTSCLIHPDPVVRDGLAFEGIQHWARNAQLSETTLMALQDRLEGLLATPDRNGFGRPFAVLTLAEVARADRVHPFLTEDRRERLTTAGVSYLTALRDYRGFDAEEGWRHGVAHASDLMLQLALNLATGRDDLVRIRDAIAAQVAPADHAYIYGESERLAAPILFMARRQEFTEAEWSAWLAQVSSPAPAATWDGAFASSLLLLKRHNVTAFLSSLYLNARLNSNSADDVLLSGTESALRALP